MGIRFFCPNGHRLNVKSELAGKVGFCPKCKAKMLIPTVSTRESGERIKDAEHEADRMFPGLEGKDKTLTSNAANSAQFEELDPEIKRAIVEPEVRATLPIQEAISSLADQTSEHKHSEKLPSHSIEDNDLLLDANVQWFFCSTDGNQYGPADSTVVKKWINEHRITPNMLVWRKDWEDWIEAGKVFPELKRIFEDEGEEISVQVNDSVSKGRGSRESMELRNQADNLLRRQKTSTKAFYAICALSGLVLILSAVLIYVLVH